MKSPKQLFITAVVIALVAACSSSDPVDDGEVTEPVESQPEEVPAEPPVDDEQEEADTLRQILEQAADGEHRSEDDRARNQYRNPVETLIFFGFTPGEQVVEIWPGGGWYTGVLAPATGDDVALRVGSFAIDEDDPEDYRTRITHEFLEWVNTHADVLGDIEMGTLDPPDTMDLGEPESAQMVLTFRNLHNMHRDGLLEDVLAAIYDVLEPGGTFGVVQHRAPEGSDPDQTAPQGYLAQSFVIETIENAGFIFEESSEINANPDDTADHPDGVWSLPPSLRGGEEGEDAQRFIDIGESDRMTLRFAKPAE